ncbi:MAG: cytochrome c biogenesis protein CcdA [Clostridia bacterium]|nr:cytochrome c biogenesis protein CcdA [Clostridia bacterium]
MEYILTFLEGIISFISPCMLPMLPVYISYFAGTSENTLKTFLRALSFVTGFTLVFAVLGLFAGTVGTFLARYTTFVNIVCGLIVVFFGLCYLDIIKLSLFKGISKKVSVTGVVSAFVFGVVFSVSLTPCIGAFLGSALMLASVSGTALKGLVMLLVYSMGLGIPFVISAILINQLKAVFGFIKSHYGIINKISGIFLIVVGIAMMTGVLNKLMGLVR